MIGFEDTQWPTTPIPHAVKELLSSFIELGDIPNSAPAARRLAEDVFTPEGKMIVNKKVISGSEGTDCLLIDIATPRLICFGIQTSQHPH